MSPYQQKASGCTVMVPALDLPICQPTLEVSQIPDKEQLQPTSITCSSVYDQHQILIYNTSLRQSANFAQVAQVTVKYRILVALLLTMRIVKSPNDSLDCLLRFQ
jgi:hypothetical protein